MSGNVPERFRTPRGGFTLVELLVVMGVITLLTALVVGVGMTLRAKAKKDAARLLIQKAERALDDYETQFGHYPHDPDPIPDPADVVSYPTQTDLENAIRLSNITIGAYLQTLDEFSLTPGRGHAVQIVQDAGDFLVVDSWFNAQLGIHDLTQAGGYSFLNFTLSPTVGHNYPGVDIWSNGPNGLNDDGGGDDINNWSRR